MKIIKKNIPISITTIVLFGLLFYIALPKISETHEAQLDHKGRWEIAKQQHKEPKIYTDGCDDWYKSDKLKPCIYGKKDSEKTALMFGDSILSQWHPALEKYYSEKDWKLISLTKSACPFVKSDFYYQKINRNYHECKIWQNRVLNFAIDQQPQTIIFGSASSHRISESAWKKETKEVIRELKKTNANIVIIEGTPRLSLNGPNCLNKLNWLKDKLPGHLENPCKNSYIEPPSNMWIRNLDNNVHNINLNHLICPDSMCSASIDGTLVFRDKSHLTVDYTLKLSEALSAELSAIEK